MPAHDRDETPRDPEQTPDDVWTGHVDDLIAAMTAAGDLAYHWDMVADRITWFGPVAQELEIGPDDLASADALNARINPEDLPRRLEALSEHFASGRPLDCEFRIRGAGGGFRWVHERGRATLDAEGRPVRMGGTWRVISARKESEAQVHRRSNYDELTGHFNRLRLTETLERAIAYGTRHGVVGAFLAVGIDGLGGIGQAYGSDVADRVVVAVSQRLDRCLRSTDAIGRLHGHTFGVVLGNCGEDGGRVAADKILEAIRSRPVDTPAGALDVTLSIGGVTFPDTAYSAREAQDMAEQALQTAKTRGSDCFVEHELSAAERDDREQRVAMGEQVRDAMRNNRLEFVFEPVVRAADGAVAFQECLIRIRGTDGLLIRANDFIPVTERLGLVRALDRATLDMALTRLDADPGISLSLNLSGLTVGDPSWMRALAAGIKTRPDIAGRLLLEITETAALEDIEESGRFVAAVHELGCRLALDDFGAGFTSFRHLKSLDVDMVKIDSSYTHDLAHNPDNQLFIKALLDVTRSFTVATVAEGVESEADAAFLRESGVEYLQGSLFFTAHAAEGRAARLEGAKP